MSISNIELNFGQEHLIKGSIYFSIGQFKNSLSYCALIFILTRPVFRHSLPNTQTRKNNKKNNGLCDQQSLTSIVQRNISVFPCHSFKPIHQLVITATLCIWLIIIQLKNIKNSVILPRSKLQYTIVDVLLRQVFQKKIRLVNPVMVPNCYVFFYLFTIYLEKPNVIIRGRRLYTV